MEMDYIFLVNEYDPNSKFSLDVKDSDWSNHATILNSLIGTLVKYTKSGIMEPYLASHFSASEDRLVWTYKLRENLYCEDGTPINAENFVKAFTRQLKLYSKDTNPIDFEHLVGYQDFHSGKSQEIEGLSVVKNEIIFRFNKPPQDPNEMFSMPYFGYWCPENLKEGNWKKNGKFISSGPYKLAKKSTPSKIVIEKRVDWFSVENDSPGKINFFLSSLDRFNSDSSLDRPFIVRTSTRLRPQESFLKNLKSIQSPPTYLLTLVLSPYKGGPFSDKKLRQYFVNKFRKNQTGTRFNSKYFYLAAKSNIQENNELSTNFKNLKFTVAFYDRAKFGYIQEIEDMLKYIFKDDGFEFQFIGNTGNDHNWDQRMISNKEFDIRLSGVGAGANIRNFIVKMMFCTKLGVCYPDPSGRICNLVTKYEENPNLSIEEYIKEFNQTLYDDASVIPVEHYSQIWIISDKIDPTSLPATVEIPMFESIRIK
jgi:hypothetical protein